MGPVTAKPFIRKTKAGIFKMFPDGDGLAVAFETTQRLDEAVLSGDDKQALLEWLMPEFYRRLAEVEQSLAQANALLEGLGKALGESVGEADEHESKAWRYHQIAVRWVGTSLRWRAKAERSQALANAAAEEAERLRHDLERVRFELRGVKAEITAIRGEVRGRLTEEAVQGFVDGPKAMDPSEAIALNELVDQLVLERDRLGQIEAAAARLRTDAADRMLATVRSTSTIHDEHPAVLAGLLHWAWDGGGEEREGDWELTEAGASLLRSFDRTGLPGDPWPSFHRAWGAAKDRPDYDKRRWLVAQAVLEYGAASEQVLRFVSEARAYPSDSALLTDRIAQDSAESGDIDDGTEIEGQ